MGLAVDVPIVVLASACWESPAPLNVHHIARRMAKRGHRVLFVESTGLRGPALGSGHDVSRIRRRLGDWRRGVRRVEQRLWVLSPLALPWSWPMRAASMGWIASAVSRACRRLGLADPVLWAFLPTYRGVADRVPHRLLVYHCVDDYAGNPGVDRAWIEAAEASVVARADLVIATSPVLAERLGRSRKDVHMMANVADVELFRRAVVDRPGEPAALGSIPRPRVVYVGNLARYRIDLELLERLATARPQVQLVFIGVVGLGDLTATEPGLAGVAKCPNVHMVGPQAHEALPALLAHCDIGLIPFLDNEHTRGSLPLKLWEYVAAGLPVVATDLPNFADPARTGAVHVARGADGFARAIDELLARPVDRARVSELAEGHDWVGRIEELSGLLAGVGA